ncbi:hypothetical protein EJB05_38509, partial [Eragrostis curvula]
MYTFLSDPVSRTLGADPLPCTAHTSSVATTAASALRPWSAARAPAAVAMSTSERPATGSPSEATTAPARAAPTAAAAEPEPKATAPASSSTAAAAAAVAEPVRRSLSSAAGSSRGRAMAVSPAATGPRCPPPAVPPRTVGAGALPGTGVAGPPGRLPPPRRWAPPSVHVVGTRASPTGCSKWKGKNLLQNESAMNKSVFGSLLPLLYLLALFAASAVTSSLPPRSRLHTADCS